MTTRNHSKTETALLDLLCALWTDREEVHDILDDFWDKNPVTDSLIEELSPGEEDDTLLAQLRVLVVEQGRAQETPAGLVLITPEKGTP